MKSLVLALAGLASALCSPLVFSQQTIVIGMSAPLSGSNAALGKEISEGALAYFRKVNAEGGVQGRNVNLIVLDDKNDRATAGANAKKLVTENKAIALFGFASATLSLDAIAVAQEQKVPFIAPFSGADTLRKASLPVYLMRASYEQEFEKLAQHWSSMGFDSAVIVHYDDEVGKQNLETAKRALAKTGKVAISLPLQRNAPITQRDIDAIVNSKSIVIVNTTLFGPFAQLLKKLRESGKPYMYSSLSFVGASQLASTAKADAAGVVMAHVVPFPGNKAIAVVRECAEAIQSAGYPEMGFASLESCIAAKAVVEALLTAALDGLGKVDLGGFTLNFGSGSKLGSDYVDLSMLNRQGTFRN
jgi:branched-chain amino acid transport system substrate-binding protein